MLGSFGQNYTGISSRAMAGISLHVAEFVSTAERREEDGAAVFVTSCGGSERCLPLHWQNVPWGKRWWAGTGLAVGRADHCWLSWHQDRYQIWGCS